MDKVLRNCVLFSFPFVGESFPGKAGEKWMIRS